MMTKLFHFRLISLFCFISLFGAKIVHAEAPCDSSRLPPDVMKVLEARYPAWKIETLGDLGENYKKMWLDKHERDCPGFASGQFDSKGNGESYVILLLPRDSKKHGFKLVVLTKTQNGEFSADVLESSTGPTSTPVVVSCVAPGKYFDAAHWKDIQTDTDAIFVEQLEVAGRLYYWKEGHFARITTSY
jgi:hypothetical protein